VKRGVLEQNVSESLDSVGGGCWRAGWGRPDSLRHVHYIMLVSTSKNMTLAAKWENYQFTGPLAPSGHRSVRRVPAMPGRLVAGRSILPISLIYNQSQPRPTHSAGILLGPRTIISWETSRPRRLFEKPTDRLVHLINNAHTNHIRDRP
jgi:hypothetical protein